MAPPNRSTPTTPPNTSRDRNTHDDSPSNRRTRPRNGHRSRRRTNRAWLRLAAYTGLRAAEISMLRGENVLLSQHLIVIAEGKGGRPGVVPAHPSVLQSLTDWGLPQAGWVFPHTYKHDEPIKAWSVSHKAADYLRSCGIDATIHQLRHRFATAVYQTSGRDLRTTQELLRHATPLSTAIYTWVDPADASQAVNAL
ncbi:MAG: site-specific integrase [Candidatus Microthrix sp.]|nr:site-specific integrase [Candidatus Microthrix sp.]